MMALCIASAVGVAKIAAAAFTLSWSHSVEKTRWEEDWIIANGALNIIEARVEGSGAGMEPGAQARFDGTFWRWKPQTPPLKELRLMQTSGSREGWTLCANGACRTIGSASQPELVLRACKE
jgi:hypothetical protein